MGDDFIDYLLEHRTKLILYIETIDTPEVKEHLEQLMKRCSEEFLNSKRPLREEEGEENGPTQAQRN